MLLSVTTGTDFRAARRRLYITFAYVAVAVLLLPLILFTASPKTAILVVAVAASLYVIGMALPLYLGVSAARRLAKFSKSQKASTALGVFYLIAPTRDWLRGRSVQLLRLDQFAALLIADGRLQFWGSGRQPRLLYELALRPGMKASWDTIDGFPSLTIHLGTSSPLPLLQWRGVLGVEQRWPSGWAERVEIVASAQRESS